MADRVDAAWTALRDCLAARSRELHDEVRSYPTPIARCDLHLPGLLEQRRQITEALQLALELRTSVEKIEAALTEAATA